MALFRKKITTADIERMKQNCDVKGLIKLLAYHGYIWSHDTSYMDLERVAKDALVEIGTPAIQPLIKLLSNWDPSTQVNAISVLKRIGKPAVTPLIKALKDADKKGIEIFCCSYYPLGYYDVDMKMGCIEALGEIGDHHAVRFLTHELTSTFHTDVECKCIEALGKSGDEKVIEILIGRNGLDNGDKYVRERAAEAIGRLADKYSIECAIEPLIDALKDVQVRRSAVRALGKTGNPEAIDALEKLKNDKGATRVDLIAKESIQKIKSSDRYTKLLFEQAKKYVSAHRYDEAAKIYESLNMWDEAGRVRQLGTGMKVPEEPKKVKPPIDKIGEFYEDIEFVDSGGFADVYKAKRRKDGRIVAVKILKELDKVAGKQFIREIRAWEGLRHTNLVELYDYNISPVPYIEMEYCSGGNLKNQQYNVMEASRIIFEICQGLKCAYQRVDAHRDIKPQNILLNNGVPKITDLGLCKVRESGSKGYIGLFTPQYASPEELRGEETDQRSDIFQIGLVFYEIVTGKPVFSGSVNEIMHKIQYEDPELPSKIVPDAKPVEPIITRCLEKKKKERWQNIAKLQMELAKILNIEYEEQLEDSKGKSNISKSRLLTGELVIINLSSGNLVGALKWAETLVGYCKSNETRKKLEGCIEALKQYIEQETSPENHFAERVKVVVHSVKMGK